MRHQRVFLAVTLVGGLMLLAACFRLAGAPINLLSVKTIVNEDESGSSTFLFVVPSDAECKLLPLRPELERLKEQAGTQVYFANYQDNEYKGFQLTYEFKSPQQIPEQIDRVKHALVQALATAYPTPAPGAMGFAHPDPDTYGVFDPNELSIQIEPMLETVGSREWKATIKLTPLMLTVPGSTEPSPSCGIPRITYDLTMPGEIATFKTGADAEADVRRYVQVTRPAPNTIRWTIEIPQGPSTPAEATKIADEIAKAPSDQERLAKIKQVFIGSTYTLTATSATPGSWFQTLTQVVAPILGLVATAIGIIVGVIKIRETLEAKAKASGKAKQ